MAAETNTDQAASWRGDLGAPDKLETRLGTMTFAYGAPTPETVSNAYDQLERRTNAGPLWFRPHDRQRAVELFEQEA